MLGAGEITEFGVSSSPSAFQSCPTLGHSRRQHGPLSLSASFRSAVVIPVAICGIRPNKSFPAIPLMPHLKASVKMVLNGTVRLKGGISKIKTLFFNLKNDLKDSF